MLSYYWIYLTCCKKEIKCSTSLAFYLFSSTRLINSIKHEHSCKIHNLQFFSHIFLSGWMRLFFRSLNTWISGFLNFRALTLLYDNYSFHIIMITFSIDISDCCRYSDILVHRLLAVCIGADASYPELLDKRKTQVVSLTIILSIFFALKMLSAMQTSFDHKSKHSKWAA